MKSTTRLVADIIIGLLMATSTIWVEVDWYHRLFIGVMFVLAAETLLRYIDERVSSDQELTKEEKKQLNRDHIFEMWRRDV